MTMTMKQAGFVAGKMRGATNADAAMQAGYSKRTAIEAGARLAKHPAIVAELARRRAAARAAACAQTGAHVSHADPLDYLLSAMNDAGLDLRLRVDAARALLPFVHAKIGAGGKKDATAAAAKRVGGKFTPAAAPVVKLVPRDP